MVYNTQYHLVWIPRFRRKFLVSGVVKYLGIQLDEVRKRYPDIVYVEKNIQPDHVHLLVIVPPRMSVSDAVQIIKGSTSRALKQKFPFLSKLYADGGGIWSVGYFVSSVGINEAIIRRYIRFQEKEDSGQAKLEI